MTELVVTGTVELLVISLTTQSPVSWTQLTVFFGGRDSPWSRPSHVSVSLVRKHYCEPFWQEHALHTLLFWQRG